MTTRDLISKAAKSKTLIAGVSSASKFLRSQEMLIERNARSSKLFRSNGAPRLFNLDAHISVIADLKAGFRDVGVDVTNWSISGSNHLVRKFHKFDDPVRHVNRTTWESLNRDMISKFVREYGQFLRTFDGFIACHPTAFSELFLDFGKPILAMSSTRYENPYTDRPTDWERLDTVLASGSDSGQITLAANNKGDRDYMHQKLGKVPALVPSLCEYVRSEWSPQIAQGRHIIAKSPALTEKIIRATGSSFTPLREALGPMYKYSKLANVREIFVVPYNISTMSLFELATIGVPVSIPSRKFMKELKSTHSGVLDEISFFEILKLSTIDLDISDLNNYNSTHFIEWWMDRADFYDSELMPNVRIVDNFDELVSAPRDFNPDYHLGKVKQRNEMLYSTRKNLIDGFVEAL